MRGLGPILDWDHLRNWLPGTIGVSAIILLIVASANWPNQTTPRAESTSPPVTNSAQRAEAPVAAGPSVLPPSSKPAAVEEALQPRLLRRRRHRPP